MIRALSKPNPPLRVCRLERLAEDLRAIDWRGDLADRLPFPVIVPGTAARDHDTAAGAGRASTLLADA